MAASTLAWLFGVTALVVFSGCGQRDTASGAERTAGLVTHADRDRGYSVSFPESWQRAGERTSMAAQAWRILDSLCLDPDYEPSWRRAAEPRPEPSALDAPLAVGR